ncbi:MAG TPA: T9SS type A sorting domain-containing protein [Candidatus Kryptonia bacterium]
MPAAQGTVNVLAVMVEFQTDQDSLTSGNGEFVSLPGNGLDAPPHDKNYFSNHLLFLKNYFQKVSGGRLNVNYFVLDSVITLPHQMKYYSPPKSSSSQSNLGLLFEDAWHAADSIYGNFDFSRYQSFVIFHAGSGRDIDFTSQLGYDPRPFDLPSLYLSPAGLQNIFGSTYRGQSVDNGNFFIDNSIIMPESESYQIYDGSGNIMIDLKLGSNGLLAASFGSFLGLPDLFDTQTGVTGIGRFGLMDGQSIFAYGGIFPPEPSAWEKEFLGWTEPLVVSPPTATTYQLRARATGQYSVLKVPISGSEYFLVENRERDALHDGENLKISYNENTSNLNFTDDTTYFDGTQVKGIDGVVTDADEYDWALPSDIVKGTKYYGGILIWHIDQNVIDQKIDSNTVNADPEHRGVALMEAHGANEIGRYIQTIFGSYYYDGSAYDFWFKGNPIPNYANRFTPTSYPTSDSYTGANSHVYITNFSSADSLMTVDVQVGDVDIQPTSGFPRNIHSATPNSSPLFARISSDGRLQVIANNGDSLFAFNMDGTSAGFDSSGLFSKVGGRYQPAALSDNASSNPLCSMDDSTLYGFSDADNNHDGTADTLFSTRVPQQNYLSSAPLLRTGNRILSFSPHFPGAWTIFDLTGHYLGYFSLTFPANYNNSSASIAAATITLPQYASIDTGSFIVNTLVFGYRVIDFSSLVNSNSVAVPIPPFGRPMLSHIAVSYASLASGRTPRVIDVSTQSISLASLQGDSAITFNCFPGDTIVSGPVVADLDGDGNRDVIFATQTKLFAISYSGAVLKYFPLTTVGSEVLSSDANHIVGSIVVADLDGDGKPEMIFGTKGGTLYAFTGATGQLFPGFPLSIGAGLAGSPAVAYDSGNLYLAAIGLDGYLYCWTFKGNSASQIVWGNLYHDESHANSVTAPLQSVQPPPSQTLMPASQVYNWPNPVTNNVTKIHFYLRDNAQVSVTIYTFAGDKVANYQLSGTGGVANEIDWNASGVQSGIYFARVEAVSSSERDVKIIKIAVVK